MASDNNNKQVPPSFGRYFPTGNNEDALDASFMEAATLSQFIAPLAPDPETHESRPTNTTNPLMTSPGSMPGSLAGSSSDPSLSRVLVPALTLSPPTAGGPENLPCTPRGGERIRERSRPWELEAPVTIGPRTQFSWPFSPRVSALFGVVAALLLLVAMFFQAWRDAQRQLLADARAANVRNDLSALPSDTGNAERTKMSSANLDARTTEIQSLLDDGEKWEAATNGSPGDSRRSGGPNEYELAGSRTWQTEFAAAVSANVDEARQRERQAAVALAQHARAAIRQGDFDQSVTLWRQTRDWNQAQEKLSRRELGQALRKRADWHRLQGHDEAAAEDEAAAKWLLNPAPAGGPANTPQELTTNHRITEVLDEASHLRLRRQWADALLVYRKAVEEFPSHKSQFDRQIAWILFARADEARWQNKYWEAIADVKEARKLVPDLVTDFNQVLAELYGGKKRSLGYEAYEAGRYEEARDAYAEAMQLMPEIEEYRTLLGYTYNKLGNAAFKQKDFKTAYSHYRRAAELCPSVANFHFYGGLALSHNGEYALAIASYTLAIENDQGKTPDYHGWRGEAHMLGSGNWEAARRDFLTCLEKAQDNPQASATRISVCHNGLAMLLALHPDPSLRDLAEAARHAEIACQDTANPSYWKFLMTRAFVFAASGSFDEAVSLLDRASTAPNALSAEIDQHRASFLARNPPAPLRGR